MKLGRKKNGLGFREPVLPAQFVSTVRSRHDMFLSLLAIVCARSVIQQVRLMAHQ